jgi:hypothetical protein
LDPSRLSAFMLAEVSFLVALTSTDNAISELAAKGLRLISHAERMSGAPVNPYISDEDRSKRNPIYEQLGDPSVTIAGKYPDKAICIIPNHTSSRPSRSPEKSAKTSSHAHFLRRNSGCGLARMLQSLESTRR